MYISICAQIYERKRDMNDLCFHSYAYTHTLMSFSIEISYLWDKIEENIESQIDHFCHEIIPEDSSFF